MAKIAWKTKHRPMAAGRALAIILMIAAGTASQALAQTPPGPASLFGDAVDEIPPELDLFDELPGPTDSLGGPAIVDPESGGNSSMLLWDEPAPLRSSGTWLRRGFWFVEEDVVIMTREYVNGGYLLGFDASMGSTRMLIVESKDAGVGISARFTLGRFLYRDDENRDHLAEFTFLGLGEWNVHGSVSSLAADNLLIPFDSSFNGFNGTDHQRFIWESRFNSYEFNYRVRRRMRRDRVVLEPTGEWTRQIDPGNIYSYLFGLRLFELDEDFLFVALSTVPSARRGNLTVRTSNDLIGFQFGGDAIHQRARWNVGVRGKTGVYVNFASMNSNLVEVDSSIVTTSAKRADKQVLAFVGELGIFAAYHLRPNVSLRIAYEALWVNSLASAAKNTDFIPETEGRIGTTAAVTLMGLSAGLDIYW